MPFRRHLRSLMLQLQAFPQELPFEYPFATAHGLKTHQPALIVSLKNQFDEGRGEAPAISYYGITVEGMLETLEKFRPAIGRYALTEPRRFWHFLHHLFPPGNNFLISALDMAAWNLFAAMRRQSLRRALGIKTDEAPATDYTLGHDSAAAMTEKIKAHPHPVYKIKITGGGDLDLLRTLRQHTAAPFRIDANEGLDFETTKALLPELAPLGVELLEQPLPRDAHEAMKELKAISPIPLIADESCREEQDIARCAEGFHGINIKLTKCGGLSPATGMISAARSLGLKVMIGSMNESIIGAAAAEALLPLADYADVDGPLLLKSEP